MVVILFPSRIVDAGININAQDLNGRTALMNALPDKFKAMELLLAAGADVNLKDKDGKTAIDIARERGFKGAKKFLKAHMKHTRVRIRTSNCITQ
jgi:ankyrin repeat protein